jgi:hypothetical protein
MERDTQSTRPGVCNLCGDRQCSDFAKNTRAVIFCDGRLALDFTSNVADCPIKARIEFEAEDLAQRWHEEERERQEKEEDELWGEYDPYET